MQELQIFKNESFGEVRTIIIDNEPWFVGKDVCQAFGDKNHSRSLSRVADDDKREEEIIDSLSRKQKAICINESGLYSLLFSMQPQKAKGVSQNDGVSNAYPIEVEERIKKLHMFKRWVTSEVLPSIRKNGGYIANQESMTDEELMAKAYQVALKVIKQKEDENNKLRSDNSQLTVDNNIMKPKAEYFDELVDRNLLTNFRETAKQLHIGEKSFIKFLIDKKYLYRDKRGKLMPYADKNKGLFEMKECFNEKTQWSGTQTLVTPKGRETFRLLYAEV